MNRNTIELLEGQLTVDTVDITSEILVPSSNLRAFGCLHK